MEVMAANEIPASGKYRHEGMSWLEFGFQNRLQVRGSCRCIPSDKVAVTVNLNGKTGQNWGCQDKMQFNETDSKQALQWLKHMKGIYPFL